MLWTIVVILVVLWLVLNFGGFVASNLIHVLLLVALIVIIINLISGRRAV